MQALLKRNLYQELIDLPELLTGEILEGQLYTHPRPSIRHTLVAFNLGIEIGNPYYRGTNGPGGWWILQEPEVHLTLDAEVVVPDLAGWRKSTLPVLPEGNKFTDSPDWVCEILSPSTEGVDREIKMPMYARHQVLYVWLINPRTCILEAYRLVEGSYEVQGHFSKDDTICIEPFNSTDIDLNEIMG